MFNLKFTSFGVGIILVALLLEGCVPQAQASQSHPTVEPVVAHGNEIGGYVELVDALRAQGATIEPWGEIDQSFKGVEGQLITVDGVEVQVFEFADQATQEATAAQISPDGSAIGATQISWTGQPNIWAKERVIAIYIGQDAATLDLLTSVLGERITSGQVPAGESVLVNSKWRLVSFGWPGAENQVGSTPVIPGSQITLEFQTGGQAGGSGGCNAYGLAYEVKGNVLSFGKITSTLIACEADGIGAQEQRYFQALETAGTFEHAGDHLVIWYDAGQGVLYFEMGLGLTSTPTATPSPCATAHPPSTPTPVQNQPTPSAKRISFTTGAISAAVDGNLAASGSDLYVLRALKGQTMTVELSFREGQAILAVWGADGTVLMSDHAEASRFEGVLPSTQDYYILLKGRPGGETDYRLEVVIPPLR